LSPIHWANRLWTDLFFCWTLVFIRTGWFLQVGRTAPAQARLNAWVIRREGRPREYLDLAVKLGLGPVKGIGGLRVHDRLVLQKLKVRISDQLGEDRKMLLHVRVCLRANRIKDANKVCFLIGKTDVAITKVKGFGKWYDSRQLQISFLLFWNKRVNYRGQLYPARNLLPSSPRHRMGCH